MYTVGGLIAIVAGILILVWPGRTLQVVTRIFGAVLIVLGVEEIFVGARSRDPARRGAAVFLGLLAAAAGIVLLVVPNVSLTALAVVVGIVAILHGLVDVAAWYAIRPGGRFRWPVLLRGVIAIAIGVVVVVWPHNSLRFIAVVFGVVLILVGLAQLLGAELNRRLQAARAEEAKRREPGRPA